MSRHPAFVIFWRTLSFTIVLLALLLPAALAWEFSTQEYLKGFAAAIVPQDASPLAKVSAILSWMELNSARAGATTTGRLTVRNPESTLTSGKLLRICGSATNAFVNLANAAGVPARRLLLLNSSGSTNHVVAEVFAENSWRVVDPVFHMIPLTADGRWLTATDLRDPVTLAAATKDVPDYQPDYTYDRTSHLRVTFIPVIGKAAGALLNRLWPDWDGSVFVSLALERESLSALLADVLLLVIMIACRAIVKRLAISRLGIAPAALAWNFSGKPNRFEPA